MTAANFIPSYRSLPAGRMLILLFAGISVWWGFRATSPPSPEPADAPETVFSADRALRHVKAIARRPHYTGSAQNDSVRAYLLDRLQELGLEPEIRSGIHVSKNESYRAVHLRNILARLEGSRSERTILLAAHYDSVPYSPGAADDASGLAAILETLRVLKARGSMQNDLLVLFTDAEELGLWGARRFAETFESTEEIDFVINLEARGSSGASILFETRAGNARLIPLLARHMRDPVANSLAYTVYSLLPNDTDFTVFKQLGIQGVNFGFIKNYLNYHTMRDTPANLSRASLQHHGNNLLDNLLLFGNREFWIDADAASDMIYFNNPFGGLTFYPEAWAWPLTAVTVLLYLAGLFYGYSRGRLALLRGLAAIAGYAGILFAGAILTWFIWPILRDSFPEYRWLQHGESYTRVWYLWLFSSLHTLLFLLWMRWIQYKVNMHNLLAGIYFVWVVLLIGMTSLLPGTSYLLLWPLLFAVIGWLLAGLQAVRDRPKSKTLAVLCVSLFMALFLLPYYINMIQVALTSRMLAACMLLYLLLLGLLWPLLDYVVRPRPRTAYLLLALGAVACIAGITWNYGFDDSEPKQNSLIYAADMDRNRFHWLSTDHATDEWTARFLGRSPADSVFAGYEVLGPRSRLYATAPALPDSPLGPQATVLRDQVTDTARHFSMQIRPPAHTAGMVFTFTVPENIMVAGLDGKTVYENIPQPRGAQNPGLSRLSYIPDSDGPIILRLSLKPGSPAPALKTVSYSYRLPSALMQRYPSRPGHMIPKPSGLTNGTIIKRTFRLGGS